MSLKTDSLLQPFEAPHSSTSRTKSAHRTVDVQRSAWQRSRPVRLIALCAVVIYVAFIPRSEYVPAASITPYAWNWDANGDTGPTSGSAPAGVRWSANRSRRVAVIGAGAGGSSASFFLSHFGSLRNESDPDLPHLATEVTLFERSNYIGGRSFPIRPWQDDPMEIPGEIGDGRDENEEGLDPPVECGASIFVAANKNLQKAARVFNLTLKDHDGEPGNMAIWDGSKFVFTESKGWGWWDTTKMFWRYGRAPLTVRSLVKTTVDHFLSLYTAPFVSRGAFDSLHHFARATNLSSLAASNAQGFLTHREKVNPLFVNELVAAACQVNYGTPVSEIHAVGALVSLAASGARVVKGGNRRIFEQFIARSGARLRMGEGAGVTEIVKLDSDEDGGRPRWLIKTSDPSQGGIFDAVILAAPYHQTGIHVVGSKLVEAIPPQPYVKLHVSFVITNASTPRAEYFGLPEKTKMPKAIFGTRDTGASPLPTFNSLNYLQPLSPEAGARFGNESTWHVVKMFSEQELDQEMLEDVFGEGNVAKKWGKVFLAYPQLDPIRNPVKELAPVRVDEGFYYVCGFERLISTMETETVSAFNVVSLLLKDLFNYTAPRSWAEWDDEK